MPKKIPDDPSIPIGSNKLASDTMFKERSLYRESAYTHPYVKGRNLWYGSYGDGVAPGKILYGRVDQSGYPVYPAEENLKQLEDIVEQLESGEVDLEKSVELYEKGMILKNQCESKLKRIETQIKKIKIENHQIKKEDFK